MPTAGDEGPWDPLWINMFRRGPWCSGEGVAAPIPPELNMYVPFSCHACKRGAICATLLPPAKLKKCSSCKIVRYCSQEHQRQDWPNHKADCKALQELRGNQAMRAVYRLSLGVFGSLEGLQRYLQHGVSILDVRAAAAGGRQPMSETAMMWTQQPHCANCYSLDGDGDQKLMACQVCGCVAWCQTCMAEMSHLMDEKGNLPHHSRAVCYTYVLSVACLGMISEQGSVLAISSNTPCEAFTAVESWTDYLDLKRSDFEVRRHRRLTDDGHHGARDRRGDVQDRLSSGTSPQTSATPGKTRHAASRSQPAQNCTTTTFPRTLPGPRRRSLLRRTPGFTTRGSRSSGVRLLCCSSRRRFCSWPRGSLPPRPRRMRPLLGGAQR
ncbi:hypothetical protein T484DRAFT_1897699 [Baffinella frigidus]|nr:hypothetical protein T484DRAFT_1897699 [Cryptophyta sp. CCMP2293]